MNCWYQVTTLTNNWKFWRTLQPCLFKVVVKNSLTLTIKYTSRYDVSFNIFLFEVQDLILYLLDLSKMFACLSLFVIFFSEWKVQILFAFWFEYRLLILLFIMLLFKFLFGLFFVFLLPILFAFFFGVFITNFFLC